MMMMMMMMQRTPSRHFPCSISPSSAVTYASTVIVALLFSAPPPFCSSRLLLLLLWSLSCAFSFLLLPLFCCSFLLPLFCCSFLLLLHDGIKQNVVWGFSHDRLGDDHGVVARLVCCHRRDSSPHDRDHPERPDSKEAGASAENEHGREDDRTATRRSVPPSAAEVGLGNQPRLDLS